MGNEPRDPGWLATLAIGAAAVAVIAILIGVRLGSPSEAAVIRTEAWPWRSDGVAVEPTVASSQFRRGDVIVAMDGRSIETWVRDALPWPIDDGLSGGPTAILGDHVAFDVMRDGSLIRLDVPLRRFPFERLGSAPVGLVVFGAGVLVLALVLLLRRARSTAIRLLFVGAVSNAADIVAWEIGLQPTDFAGSPLFLIAFASAAAFNLVFWSTIVHILAIYPVRSPLVDRRPIVIPLIYAIPLLALVVLAGGAALAGGTVLDWIDRLAAVVAGVASAMLIVVIASTILAYRRTSRAERRGVRTVAVTLVAAAIVTLVLLTGPIVLAGVPLVSRGTVSLLALPVPIAIAIAAIRDRLFQVGRLSQSRERIVAAREEERRRLRRELHDGLGPTLAAIALKLDSARAAVRSDPPAAEAAIDAVRTDVRAAVAEIRRMARDLRPPTLDALGLVGAIREQAGTLGASGDGPVIIVDVQEPVPALPAAVEVAGFRIVVEALMNAVRHAEASRCDVTIRVADDLLDIEVVDDGRGIGDAPAGVGSRAMRERAAEVGGDVLTAPAEAGGTRVWIRLPVGGPVPTAAAEAVR